MRTLRYSIQIAAISFASLASGCESGMFGDGRTLYSYTMAAANGYDQQLASGGAESEPLVVRVYLNESPTSGITVKWSILEGDGSLSSDSGVSDANGYAQTTYISANEGGEVRIRATVDFDSSGFENFAGREVTPVTFTITVTTDQE